MRGFLVVLIGFAITLVGGNADAQVFNHRKAVVRQDWNYNTGSTYQSHYGLPGRAYVQPGYTPSVYTTQQFYSTAPAPTNPGFTPYGATTTNGYTNVPSTVVVSQPQVSGAINDFHPPPLRPTGGIVPPPKVLPSPQSPP